MSKQIFKKNLPNEYFFNFLLKVCDTCKVNNINAIIFTKISFNKLKYHKQLEPFCNQLRDFYHSSKQKYITNVNNYSKFITIIRQICKANNIIYINKCKYIKSKYEPVYYILTEFPDIPELSEEDLLELQAFSNETLMELQELSDESNIYLPNMVLDSNNCDTESLANQEYLDLNNTSSSDT
tara:strand:+ start:46 stop:591 length:546 start_codon:yes stop_codon:yes gene_type:complete